MKLDEFMKAKKITAKELAEKTGISRRTIEGYRANVRVPNFPAGLKIAKALGVDPYELLDDDEKII